MVMLPNYLGFILTVVLSSNTWNPHRTNSMCMILFHKSAPNGYRDADVWGSAMRDELCNCLRL